MVLAKPRRAVARRSLQIKFVKERFDRSALDSLGFVGDAEERLSRRAIGRFRADAQAGPADVTFRDLFLTSTRSIPDREDRAALAEAVAGGDGNVEMLARVVAADLDLWFRSEVLVAQDVLVDTAHLVSRMPFLIGKQASDLAAYDRVATAVDDAACGFSARPYRSG